MAYTRKEIVNWVDSWSKYKFQELKNGVFFCKMLQMRFPQQKIKYNSSPVSDYDCTSNLNIMKKVLNRRGLQLNLNVVDILGSKNNFQLAKWFKNLIDRDQCGQQSSYCQNISQLQTMSRTSSCFNQALPLQKKMQIGTPKYRQEQPNFFRKGLESAQKNRNHNSNSNIKRLSMAKSQNHFFKNKKQLYNDIKIPKSKNIKKQPSIKIFPNQSLRMVHSQQKEEEDIGNLMYERALEQSIDGLQKVLNKIQLVLVDTFQGDFDGYREKIRSAIFKK